MPKEIGYLCKTKTQYKTLLLLIKEIGYDTYLPQFPNGFRWVIYFNTEKRFASLGYYRKSPVLRVYFINSHTVRCMEDDTKIYPFTPNKSEILQRLVEAVIS